MKFFVFAMFAACLSHTSASADELQVKSAVATVSGTVLSVTGRGSNNMKAAAECHENLEHLKKELNHLQIHYIAYDCVFEGGPVQDKDSKVAEARVTILK